MKSASAYCTATSVRHNQRPGRRATCSAIASPYRHELSRQRRTCPPRMTAAYDRFSACANPPPAQTKKTSLQGLPRKHAFPQSNLFGECTARRRAVRFASFGKTRSKGNDMGCYPCTHCNKCGIFSVKAETRCANCGALRTPGTSICSKCGSKETVSRVVSSEKPKR